MRRRAAAIMALGVAAASVAVPGPAAACVDIGIHSTGYHVDLIVPAGVFAEGHPIRALAPAATAYQIGWGEQGFYQSPGDDLWLGLRALLPPSPSVLHVTAFAAPVTPSHGVVGVDTAGAAALAAYVDAAIARDPAGGVRVLGPGHGGAASWFLAGTEGFHAFNVCNAWTARALRAAGLDVAAGPGWFAAALTRQTARLPGCAAAASRH